MAVTARRLQGFVQANCMMTDQVGQAVYIRAQANGFYKVWRCDPTTTNKMPAIGIIIRKWFGAGTYYCLVQMSGELRDLYTDLVPGKRYFVGMNGRPALPADFTEPEPGERQHVQALGVALDTRVLLVEPSEDMVTRVG